VGGDGDVDRNNDGLANGLGIFDGANYTKRTPFNTSSDHKKNNKREIIAPYCVRIGKQGINGSTTLWKYLHYGPHVCQYIN
jgi:hypothetical protein